MTNTLAKIRQQIMADPANQAYTERGIAPLFQAGEQARILIIGQAPGIKAEERGILFADPSGDRLRSWLGVDEATFYDADKFAILPMDFYYPGKGKSGDLPPRKGFAEKWHPVILEHLNQVELTMLIGQYAQKFYLKGEKKASLTATVQAYQDYLPAYFPLVHPSPRNNIWLAKNPWFSEQVLPKLHQKVSQILSS